MPKSMKKNYYGRLSLYEDQVTTLNNVHNGYPVSYLVDFPFSNVLPKLTYVSINGQLICSSNEYPPPSTTLELQHKLEETVNAFPSTDLINQNNNKIFDKNLLNQDRIPNQNVVSSTPQSTTLIQDPRRQQQHKTSLQSFSKKNQQNRSEIHMNLNNVKNVKINSPVNVEYSKLDQNRMGLFEQCGLESNSIKLTPFIQFGTVLSQGQFPWLTAIYKKHTTGTKFICGGSLVSSRTVLTAAHCFKIIGLTADRVVVYLGRHNLESYDGVVAREVSVLITHPEYDTNSLPDADIAILQLESSVGFMPICLWNDLSDLNHIVGQTGYVAGWGGDENGHEVSPLPKMVDAKIVSENECRKSVEAFKVLTSPRTLCAGNKDGSGPCMGDSGGGLMINRNGRWFLRGIVSAGQTKQQRCDLQQYVIYCDVAKHLTWVQQYILK